jgi:hypothetical protein
MRPARLRRALGAGLPSPLHEDELADVLRGHVPNDGAVPYDDDRHQILVLFVIRTPRNPTSRPSPPLAVTTMGMIVLGVSLPYSPLARTLGFEALPGGYFLFLVGALTYLSLVEIAKRYLLASARKYRHRVPIATPKLEG